MHTNRIMTQKMKSCGHIGHHSGQIGHHSGLEREGQRVWFLAEESGVCQHGGAHRTLMTPEVRKSVVGRVKGELATSGTYSGWAVMF